jgi:hypothetical protein
MSDLRSIPPTSFELVSVSLCSDPSAATGYGRDFWEALSNSGLSDGLPPESYSIKTVTVHDLPASEDQASKRIAHEMCDFFSTHECIETGVLAPPECLDELRELLGLGLYAKACWYCSNVIWDWIDEDPEEEPNDQGH